jgi:hypothetical protein
MARKLQYNEEEGGMAKSQLMKIENYAKKLNEMIHPEDELEGWVQSKLSVIAAYMGDIKHYLDYELKKFGEGGNVEKDLEMYEIEFTWDKKHEDDFDSRTVRIWAESIEEAQELAKRKFAPYYGGFKIVEVEKEEDDDDDDEEPMVVRGFSDGESYEYAEGGKIKSLEDFNLDDLDSLERFQYNHFKRKNTRMSKAEVLQFLINNVDGDYGQLSDELRKIAQKEQWTVNLSSSYQNKTKYVLAKSKSEAIGEAFRLITQDGDDSDDFQVDSVYKKYKQGGGIGDLAIREQASTHEEDMLDAEKFIGRDKWAMLSKEDKIETMEMLKSKGYIGFPAWMEKIEDMSYAKGGKTKGGYKVFEGYDHYQGIYVYRVESIGDDEEYIGEWHTNFADAQKELERLKK